MAGAARHLASLRFILIVSLISQPEAWPQSHPSPASAQEGAGTPLPQPRGRFVLEDGTPVKLKITRTMSSEDARVDERVDFEVLEDVKVHDVVVIPRGGTAWATVTEAQPKRRLGRGGKLQMNIDAVKLVNGDKVSLRAVKDVKGGGKTGAMTAGLVVTGLLFWPAAPFFLFMKGKDITVPKGTEITAYTQGDIPLAKAAFLSASPPTQTYTVGPGQAVPENAGSGPVNPPIQTYTIGTFGSPGEESHTTEVAVSSVPEGADIEIDGSLMGNAPSTVRLSAGEHSIAIKKSGYRVWERKIRTSGGSIKINAELERIEEPAQPK